MRYINVLLTYLLTMPPEYQSRFAFLIAQRIVKRAICYENVCLTVRPSVSQSVCLSVFIYLPIK